MTGKDLIGINKSYCISLKKHETHWVDILDTIHKNGFPSCEIFEGILGNSYKDKDVSGILSPWQEYILKFGDRRHNHEHFITWGGLGCYLSHATIWQDALDKGYDRVAIFEDDVYFQPNFAGMLNSSIERVPKDYQLLLFDAIKLDTTEIKQNENKQNENTVLKVNRFFGTHAYVITRECMSILLSRAYPIEIQVDSYMSFMIKLLDLKFYDISGLCGQQNHFSSIQTLCIDCPDLGFQKFKFINTLVDNIVPIIGTLVIFTVIITYLISRRNCKL